MVLTAEAEVKKCLKVRQKLGTRKKHTGGKFWGDDRFLVGFNDHVKFATLKSKCRLSLTIAGSPSYLIATDEPTTGH